MPTRMLGPEGCGCEIPQVGEEKEAFFIRMLKSLPSRRVLKTLRESPTRTISTYSGLGLGFRIAEEHFVSRSFYGSKP